MASYEIKHVRKLSLGRPQRGHWRGVRAFLCSEADAPGLAWALIDNHFPNLPGSRWAKCTNCDIDWYPFGVPGVALVLAHHATQRTPGIIDVYTRPNNESGTRLTVDLNGNIIEGAARRSTTTKSIEFWQIVAGSNYLPNTRTDFLVKTSVTRSSYNEEALTWLRNTVNASSFGLRGNRAAGTLRYNYFIAKDVYGDNYIDVDHYISYEPGGWNNLLKVQRGTWQARQFETNDSEGALTGEYREVMVFAPGKTEQTDGTLVNSPVLGTRVYETANWGVIPNRASW